MGNLQQKENMMMEKFNEIEVSTLVSEKMIKRLIKDDEEYKYNIARGKHIYEKVNKYGIKEQSLCQEYRKLLKLYTKQRKHEDDNNIKKSKLEDNVKVGDML